MSTTWHCSACGQDCVGPTCGGCGGKQGEVGAGNPLVLVAWLCVWVLIPVYPIAGGLASLALVGSFGLTELLQVPDGVQLLLAAIVTYGTLFLTFRLERRASESRGYRLFRDIYRVLAGVGVVIRVLTTEGAATPADTLFIAVFGVPLAFWALKRIDGVFGAAGPPKAPKPVAVDGLPGTGEKRAPSFLSTLNWRSAAAFGGMLSLVGFIIGDNAQLFTVAFLWLAITGGILGVQIVGHLLSKSFRLTSGVNMKMGRVPGALIYGAGGGAIAGAVLGKILDGRVQIEAVIIVAIVGVLIALAINRFRTRSGVNASGS